LDGPFILVRLHLIIEEIPSPAVRNRALIGLLIPHNHIARAEIEIGNKTNPQPNPQFMMTCATYGYFGSPRVVVSCCKTNPRYAVTAEAAGSSPVVPASVLNQLPLFEVFDDDPI